MKHKPFFKPGDKITFKHREDCRDLSGKKKYYHGGDDRGGETTTVTAILAFNDFYQCYLIVESKYRYRMLESEFVEYYKQDPNDNYSTF